MALLRARQLLISVQTYVMNTYDSDSVDHCCQEGRIRAVKAAILVDTGALYALADESDQWHQNDADEPTVQVELSGMGQ